MQLCSNFMHIAVSLCSAQKSPASNMKLGSRHDQQIIAIYCSKGTLASIIVAQLGLASDRPSQNDLSSRSRRSGNISSSRRTCSCPGLYRRRHSRKMSQSTDAQFKPFSWSQAYASATIGCPKVRTSVVSALFAAGKESATVNMCKAALVLCGKTWGASTQNSMQLLQ